jgi:hypothetical protein
MRLGPLFRVKTWRELPIAIRRARRDARARIFLRWFVRNIALALWRALAALLFIAALIAVFEKKIALVDAIIVSVCGLAVFLIHKWRDRQDAESAAPFATPAVQQEMHRELFLLATLLIRAGSERLMEKELPPEIEITTRQAQRDRLIQHGLWDELPAAMRDLLLLPNGHWSSDQKLAAESCWEYFLVLRWVLRQDESLRSLQYGPSYNLAKASEVVDRFGSWQPGDTLAPWDLRPFRDEADYHFGRLWTEAVARGLLQQGIEPEQRKETLRIKALIDANGASTDLLINTQTVSELSDPQLWFLARVTHRRWEILNFLINWLAKGDPQDGLRQLWSRTLSD